MSQPNHRHRIGIVRREFLQVGFSGFLGPGAPGPPRGARQAGSGGGGHGGGRSR